jgi:hypothetical protein
MLEAIERTPSLEPLRHTNTSGCVAGKTPVIKQFSERAVLMQAYVILAICRKLGS